MTSAYTRNGQPYGRRGAHPSKVITTPVKVTTAASAQPTTWPAERIRRRLSRSIRAMAVTIPGQAIRT
ncbi:hypothetical protein ACQP2K_06465 [Microbispora siamensis]